MALSSSPSTTKTKKERKKKIKKKASCTKRSLKESWNTSKWFQVN
jgi:hypothetical protein